MKDAIHHMKHVQKKVIQSIRKSQAQEEVINEKKEKVLNQAKTFLESPVSAKRRQINSQLQRSFRI